MFDNVAIIDASINALCLGEYTSIYHSADFLLQIPSDAPLFSFSAASFSSFVSLRELNLSLNGVCSMTFDAADFPHLEVR